MTVIAASLRKESRDRYLTYALSVVTGRALPDVRDGLKPVQRRILFAMLKNLNLRPSSSYRKSAAVVGEVLARFHPHGDIACYEAMVRMAQTFSLRYPLVDGQGNFGSLDGDSAAAYRYTEARLLPLAIEVLGEIDEETVEFRDNFDSTTQEPCVLPSRVPNMLVNGASGIAVGMATSIPPHNLRDTIKALVELSKDPELSNSHLVGLIKAPDFPTGCSILNTKKELNEIYQSGRGQIRMQADWVLEEQARGKRCIVISTIPYATNKAQLVEKIANLIIEKKVPQLIDVRDESTEVIRIVLELASGADAEIAMAYLYKHTPLDSNFQVNLTALVPQPDGSLRPELLSLKAILQHFLDFRNEVVARRLKFERKNLLERIHILEGLIIIFDALDEALKIVRSSNGRTDAAEKLRKRFKLSEKQAFAVVDMRVYQLSKTNIQEVRKELEEKGKRVAEIEAILKSKAKIMDLVRKDLEALQQQFGDNRICSLKKSAPEIEIDQINYVVREEVYAIVTRDGWLKRIRQSNELSSTRLREGDSILRAHPLSTLDKVAFFTNLGNLYVLNVSDFPSSSGYGSPIQKLLKFSDGEMLIDTYGVPVDEQETQGEFIGMEYPFLVIDEDPVVLITRKGVGFCYTIEGLEGIKRNGKRVIKLRDGDQLAAVCHLEKNIAFFTQKGSGLCIKDKEIPIRNSAAVGVALMGVRKDDRVVSAVSYEKASKFLVDTESGRGKEIASSEVLAGRRGLMGRKVITRGEILEVRKG